MATKTVPFVSFPLTRGLSALVDVADLPLVADIAWSAVPGCAGGRSTFYAVHSERSGLTPSGTLNTRMHRLILGLVRGDGILVDHRNLNGLDNRRSNLRICTRQQNQWNKTMLSTNRSGFKGVYFHRISGRWSARIQMDGRSAYLGLFDTPEDAAAAYNEAACRLHGEFARLNIVPSTSIGGNPAALAAVGAVPTMATAGATG